MIYKSEQGRARFLLAGDAMLSRRLSPFTEPQYLDLLHLIRGADAAFANLETTVRERNEGHPNFTQGTPMSTHPLLVQQLADIGFSLFSSANNHAADYGVSGMIATIRHLRRLGLAFSGIGMNLSEACAPAYLDTEAGRIALISATSFFQNGEQASEQRPDCIGRPGINPLRFSTTYHVDAESFAMLKKVNEKLGFQQEQVRRRAQFFSPHEAPENGPDQLNFQGTRILKGEDFHFSTSYNKDDAAANLRWIREARRQADWVIFSLHNHEFGAADRLTAASRTDLPDPAKFFVDFAHEAIDAGADIVAGHGPHVALGVEIYKGRPILCSLGNFILQNDSVEIIPSESYSRFGLEHDATPADFFDARSGNRTRSFSAFPEYWQSYVATCEFAGHDLKAVNLHPIDLGFGLSRAQQGRPVLASGEVAKRILSRAKSLSLRNGTTIEIDGELGRIRL